MIVALSGGVGGAKLSLGLSRILPPEALCVVVNTADDFEHLGLYVSPDLDTVMYTLAGVANPQTGWGLRDESWAFMAALARLGGETWFQLGDRDLATHVERTRRLRSGESLHAITADFCRRLGVGCSVLPMTDDPVRTMLCVEGEWIAFQDYFVRLQCAPAVSAIRFDGAANARASGEVLAALASPTLRAVIICPSNPYLSVDPILAVPGIRDAIASCAAPVVAVSPIVGEKAIKGPAAKLMAELGVPVTARSVARHYGRLIDAFIVDSSDERANEEDRHGVPVFALPTLMSTLADKEALASRILALLPQLDGSSRGAGA
ncbi:MAG: 2-phospho-L-lactate transferase [Lautropia sp.]